MRRTVRPQSALRAPLNTILGTEANVRLLRVLERTHEPMSGAELARETALTPPAVYAALDRLSETGMVERLGLKSRGQFRWNEKHPIASALRSLFAFERGRVERLVEGLKQAASSLSPPPRSVWWYGPSARSEDRLGDPLQVAIVADARTSSPSLIRNESSSARHKPSLGFQRSTSSSPKAERLEWGKLSHDLMLTLTGGSWTWRHTSLLGSISG